MHAGFYIIKFVRLKNSSFQGTPFEKHYYRSRTASTLNVFVSALRGKANYYVTYNGHGTNI